MVVQCNLEIVTIHFQNKGSPLLVQPAYFKRYVFFWRRTISVSGLCHIFHFHSNLTSSCRIFADKSTSSIETATAAVEIWRFLVRDHISLYNQFYLKFQQSVANQLGNVHFPYPPVVARDCHWPVSRFMFLITSWKSYLIQYDIHLVSYDHM